MIFWCRFSLILLLMLRQKVDATPHLIARNEESFPLPSPPSLPNPIPGIIDFGQDVIDGTENLFKSPAEVVPKTSPPITKPDPGEQPFPVPANPDFVTDTNPPTTYHLSLPLTIPESKDCDLLNLPGTQVSEECQIPSPKIIYPVDCNEDESFGSATVKLITQSLKKEVAKNKGRGSTEVDVCEIPICRVLFWAAELTDAQVLRMLLVPGVKDIAVDQPIQSGNDPQLASDWSEELTNERHKKRAVLARRNKFKDLAFISTALGNAPSEDYHYFEENGKAVVTYAVCEGLGSHQQVRPKNIRGWLFAKGAPPGKSDNSFTSAGTCDISKLVGVDLGVANDGEVIVVKIKRTVESFLAGLSAVARDLEKREKRGEQTRGFTVLQSSMYWIDDEKLIDSAKHKAALKIALNILINTYQVPLVFAAGNNLEGGYKDIDTLPAKLSTDQFYPMIVVGSVNLQGVTYPWSQGGLALTITAPGAIECAGFDKGRQITRVVKGTGVSAGITAGLAMYFLSIQEVRNHLLSQDNLASALRDYIVLSGYVRTSPKALDRAIWNGLDPTRPNDNYGWQL